MTTFIKSRKRKNSKEYIPKYPEKYTGSWPIIYLSEWEHQFCRWVDYNPNILEWSSEGIGIKYLDPMKPGTNKIRRYYPDFWIKTKKLERFVIEIKPLKETKPPVVTKKKSQKTILYERKTWETNKAKFKAAERYCNKMKMKFKILTEKDLFVNK